MLLGPCDRPADPVLIFFFSSLFSFVFLSNGVKQIPAPLLRGCPEMSTLVSSVAVSRKSHPDEFSSHSSDSNMSHRVSPCRASSWFRTRRRLSPTCCVCLPAATCTTSVSKSPLQVRIGSTRTAAGLRPSVLLQLQVYQIDSEIFSPRPSRTATPGEESVFHVVVKYLPVKTWLV